MENNSFSCKIINDIFIELSIKYELINLKLSFFINEISFRNKMDYIDIDIDIKDIDIKDIDIEDINFDIYFDNGNRYYYELKIHDGNIEFYNGIIEFKMPIIPQFTDGIIEMFRVLTNIK
jgi:hypothetical protein